LWDEEGKEVMGELNELVERIQGLEIWKNGDGARGAEVRLQTVEERLSNTQTKCRADLSRQNTEDITDIKSRMLGMEHRQEDCMTKADMIEMTEDTKTKFIVALRAERKRGMEKVKAWAPYVVAACALAAAIIPQLVKK
jgi:hypothetical protein